MTHREKCKELKEMRRQMADKIGVDLHQRECTYEGECSGTCPKCAQEEKTLNKFLLKSAVALASVAVSATALTGCGKSSEPEHVKDPDSAKGKTSEDNKCDTVLHKTHMRDGKSYQQIVEGDVDVQIEGGMDYFPPDDPDVLEGEALPDDLEGDVAIIYATETQIVDACIVYSGAPVVAVDSIEGSIYHVHCYEEVEDGDDAHVATIDWIDVDAETGIATTLLGDTFNIYDYIQ